jgi:hypothetical protein
MREAEQIARIVEALHGDSARHRVLERHTSQEKVYVADEIIPRDAITSQSVTVLLEDVDSRTEDELTITVTCTRRFREPKPMVKQQQGQEHEKEIPNCRRQ